MSATIHLVVQSREGVLFEDNVLSITSENKTGKFDILPDHANFMTRLTDVIVIKVMDGTTQSIPVRNGIMQVAGNKVQVLLGIKE